MSGIVPAGEIPLNESFKGIIPFLFDGLGDSGMASGNSDQLIEDRLDPEKKIPAPLNLGLALQLAGLVLPGIVLIPAIVFRAAGEAESVTLWAVFASVVICGAATILQGLRIGYFGAGYILATGTAGVAIAVSIAALVAGGPALLAALVFSLAVFQFAVSAKLSLFRRIITPTVTGTVMMLTPVSVMPYIFDQLNAAPESGIPLAAPISALATLLTIAWISLKTGGVPRLWAPLIGIVAGTSVAGAFGMYDFARIAEAPWVGIPQAEWPAFDFGLEFLVLLPAFLFIALICTIQSIGIAVAIQRVSRAERRAVDFRAIQGAVAADGVANLLSALTGTIPVVLRPNGASIVEITGVSSRHIGATAGALLIVFACLPKALAVILAIPGPVIAAFITIAMASIFVTGMATILQDGIDYRNGLIAGVSFWIGTGFQNGAIFPQHLTGLAGDLLSNGMMSGGLAAIVLTTLLNVARRNVGKIQIEFDQSAFKEIRDFIAAFASKNRWDEAMAARLDAVGEETLLALQDQREDGDTRGRRRLLLVARSEEGGVVLEFFASKGDENLQDQIAFLGDADTEESIEREVSLRLLRHHAASVRHQQYHNTEIITVRVEPPR